MPVLRAQCCLESAGHQSFLRVCHCVHGLSYDTTPHVCTCTRFCAELKDTENRELLLPWLPQLLEQLVQLCMEVSEDARLLVLEALSCAIKAGAMCRSSNGLSLSVCVG